MGQKKTCSCNNREHFPNIVKSNDGKFERSISFKAGYVCEKSGPNSHGKHGMEILFFLRGPKGIIQFLVYTNWVPGEVGNTYKPTMYPPMGVDLGYHSPVPMYDGQTPFNCVYFQGGKCYYDGSSLQASKLMVKFVEHGESVVWDQLMECYKYRFESEDLSR